MKKFILTFITTLAFVGYIIYERGASPQPAVPTTAVDSGGSVSSIPASSNPVATGASPTPTPSPAVSPAGQPTPSPSPQGQYKDGQYTGNSADAYYGIVQVQATVAGGKLTDVAFLQYPSDRGTSREISQRSMPVLKTEAITAQSAQVDIVSGATQTSEAFQQSLASALALAKN